MQSAKNTSYVVGNPDGMYSKEREAFEMLKPHMRRMNLKYRISPIKILTPLFKANFPGIIVIAKCPLEL